MADEDARDFASGALDSSTGSAEQHRYGDTDDMTASSSGDGSSDGGNSSNDSDSDSSTGFPAGFGKGGGKGGKSSKAPRPQHASYASKMPHPTVAVKAPRGAAPSPALKAPLAAAHHHHHHHHHHRGTADSAPRHTTLFTHMATGASDEEEEESDESESETSDSSDDNQVHGPNGDAAAGGGDSSVIQVGAAVSAAAMMNGFADALTALPDQFDLTPAPISATSSTSSKRPRPAARPPARRRARRASPDSADDDEGVEESAAGNNDLDMNVGSDDSTSFPVAAAAPRPPRRAAATRTATTKPQPSWNDAPVSPARPTTPSMATATSASEIDIDDFDLDFDLPNLNQPLSPMDRLADPSSQLPTKRPADHGRGAVAGRGRNGPSNEPSRAPATVMGNSSMLPVISDMDFMSLAHSTGTAAFPVHAIAPPPPPPPLLPQSSKPSRAKPTKPRAGRPGHPPSAPDGAAFTGLSALPLAKKSGGATAAHGSAAPSVASKRPIPAPAPSANKSRQGVRSKLPVDDDETDIEIDDMSDSLPLPLPTATSTRPGGAHGGAGNGVRAPKSQSGPRAHAAARPGTSTSNRPGSSGSNRAQPALPALPQPSRSATLPSVPRPLPTRIDDDATEEDDSASDAGRNPNAGNNNSNSNINSNDDDDDDDDDDDMCVVCDGECTCKPSAPPRAAVVPQAPAQSLGRSSSSMGQTNNDLGRNRGGQPPADHGGLVRASPPNQVQHKPLLHPALPSTSSQQKGRSLDAYRAAGKKRGTGSSTAAAAAAMAAAAQATGSSTHTAATRKANGPKPTKSPLRMRPMSSTPLISPPSGTGSDGALAPHGRSTKQHHAHAPTHHHQHPQHGSALAPLPLPSAPPASSSTTNGTAATTSSSSSRSRNANNRRNRQDRHADDTESEAGSIASDTASRRSAHVHRAPPGAVVPSAVFGPASTASSAHAAAAKTRAPTAAPPSTLSRRQISQRGARASTPADSPLSSASSASSSENELTGDVVVTARPTRTVNEADAVRANVTAFVGLAAAALALISSDDSNSSDSSSGGTSSDNSNSSSSDNDDGNDGWDHDFESGIDTFQPKGPARLFPHIAPVAPNRVHVLAPAKSSSRNGDGGDPMDMDVTYTEYHSTEGDMLDGHASSADSQSDTEPPVVAAPSMHLATGSSGRPLLRSSSMRDFATEMSLTPRPSRQSLGPSYGSSPLHSSPFPTFVQGVVASSPGGAMKDPFARFGQPPPNQLNPRDRKISLRDFGLGYIPTAPKRAREPESWELNSSMPSTSVLGTTQQLHIAGGSAPPPVKRPRRGSIPSALVLAPPGSASSSLTDLATDMATSPFTFSRTDGISPTPGSVGIDHLFRTEMLVLDDEPNGSDMFAHGRATGGSGGLFSPTDRRTPSLHNGGGGNRRRKISVTAQAFASFRAPGLHGHHHHGGAAVPDLRRAVKGHVVTSTLLNMPAPTSPLVPFANLHSGSSSSAAAVGGGGQADDFAAVDLGPSAFTSVSQRRGSIAQQLGGRVRKQSIGKKMGARRGSNAGFGTGLLGSSMSDAAHMFGTMPSLLETSLGGHDNGMLGDNWLAGHSGLGGFLDGPSGSQNSGTDPDYLAMDMLFGSK
ncbi:hypothetical protein BC828DRAFT_401699 [Blastocladiella britannica]|nr:hypothetical protein BC828DRAFT_401699 [Blastocladiella britannica]